MQNASGLDWYGKSPLNGHRRKNWSPALKLTLRRLMDGLDNSQLLPAAGNDAGGIAKFIARPVHSVAGFSLDHPCASPSSAASQSPHTAQRTIRCRKTYG